MNYKSSLKIDTRITTMLSSLGLGSTEQTIYLVGLAADEIGVSELVQKTGINRTTVYHALATLNQKGFASETKIQGQLAYRMALPSEFINYLSHQQALLGQQKTELEVLVPLFPSVNESGNAQTHIEKFETIDAIKNAIEKALYCRSRNWNIIAPKDNFFSQIDKTYADYFMQTRRSRGIKSKTLWETKAGEPPDLRLADIVMRQPRYLPPSYRGKFKSVIILFDDKALFISSLGRQTAVLMQSPEAVDTLNVLFDSLWLAAMPPSKVK